MYGVQTDLLARLRSFLDAFGGIGVLVLAFAALIIGIIVLWRGTGFAFLLLFLSFSLGAIQQGGVIFVSTLVRWGCLILLGIGLFKRPQFYGKAMLFFAFYVFLGTLFVFYSPLISFSAQQAALLIMTTVGVSVAINSYVTSPEKIDNLFKMGIVAAAVWTVTSMMFISDFLYSSNVRFSTSQDIGGVRAVYAGAFFSPMVVWGIIQNRYLVWRILCVILFVPFAFLIFICGVRTAILGMLIIASLPIIFTKIRPIRFILITGVLGGLVAATLVALFYFIPQKAQFLIDRIFTTSTSGRYEMWQRALELCLDSGFLGHGIGGSDAETYQINLVFHNSYLDIWYNAGMLGLFTVLIFLIVYVVKSFHFNLANKVQEIDEYGRILLGYMLGMIAMSMFEGILSSAGGIGVVMLMIVCNLIDQLRHFQSVESYCYSEYSLERHENTVDEKGVSCGKVTF